MHDQAEQLRLRMTGTQVVEPKARTIAIASGIEGEGKSTFVVNFAIKLMEQNQRVLIFDLDAGKGKIDRLLEVHPSRSLVHLFTEGKTIHDIIEQAPSSLSYLAAGAGVEVFSKLDECKFQYFQSQFEELNRSFDYILFNMRSNVEENCSEFMTAAHEAILVTTLSPASITSAYGLVKRLLTKEKEFPISILHNRFSLEKNSEDTSFRLQEVIHRHLKTQVQYLGAIPEDRAVIQSIIQKTPYTIQFPEAQASKSIGNIVYNYINLSEDKLHHHEFLLRLRRFISEGARR
ncbi:flagellar biosynthesis protein FlhG [Halobacillus alkaliphilus]|uniref:Flagellar biosynthesis protein FlhG n=1 Tax=Halobacillus alkaliphilus TaxID=396056 RepID=A0A1I2L0Q3_9BACI|nr:AAA family ATPase [Halobacillus alkaliphilus]SFF70736.1 flagellar biosynthesis protein FlhG [Halobacillus alkaliphilus]